MKNQSFYLNLSLMLFVAYIFSSYTIHLVLTHTEGASDSFFYILGRSIGSVIFPLFIVSLAVSIFRRNKPKFTKGVYVSWWFLSVVISVLALLGNMLPPTGN